MIMEKHSLLLLWCEFVRQYSTLLNQVQGMLPKFYGKNSFYIHRVLDSKGKLADTV